MICFECHIGWFVSDSACDLFVYSGCGTISQICGWSVVCSMRTFCVQWFLVCVLGALLMCSTFLFLPLLGSAGSWNIIFLSLHLCSRIVGIMSVVWVRDKMAV